MVKKANKKKKNRDTDQQQDPNLKEQKKEVRENDDAPSAEEDRADQEFLAEEDRSDSEDDTIEKNSEPEVDFKSKYFYLAAEMENARKRYDREREKLIKYGNEKILSSLIGVIDNLEHSLNSIGETEDEKIKSIAEGIEMVKKQFLNVLEENGLTLVKTMGEIFDPKYHEAMSQQQAEGKQEHEIIGEFQKGYILNGRLLRAAKVMIAKNS